MSRYPDIALSDDDTFALARRGYTIGKEPLGLGAFGIVYKATLYDQETACKSIFVHESTNILNVINEMFVLKKLSNHPNIVHVIGFYFIASSHLLIFMELVSGGTLRGPMKKKDPKGLKEPIVGKFFQQIGNGLLFMHDCGFAHRDLKPENIMLSNKKPEQAVAKITDFGMSDAFYDTLTGEEKLVARTGGTCLYMSPEVLSLVCLKLKGRRRTFGIEDKSEEKSKTFDDETFGVSQFSADVFTLGIILFELLHGNRKFPNNWPRGTPPSHAKVLDYYKSFRRGFNYNEKISPECVDLLKGMLEKDPSKRLSMEQVMEHQWVKNPGHYAAEAKAERRRDKRCFCV